MGDHSKAIEYFKQSLEIAREIKDRQGEGSALASLGIAYIYQYEYIKASEYFQNWLMISREIRDRQSEGRALNNLGIALYKAGNLTSAENFLFQGIEVWESLTKN